MAGNDANTNLLLHCDGVDTSTSFTDSSFASPTHIITAEGNAQVDTDQKKFGTGSALFDGTGDYLTVPDHADWNFGGGNFTIDLQIRMSRLDPPSGNSAFFSQTADLDNRFLFYWNSAVGLALYAKSGATYTIAFNQGSVDGWSADTWYHVSLVRNGNEWDLYREGVSLANITNSNTLADIGGDLWLGQQNDGIFKENYWGWMDEYRVSKGIARWTANFTPPSAAYPYVIDRFSKSNNKTTYYCGHTWDWNIDGKNRGFNS